MTTELYCNQQHPADPAYRCTRKANHHGSHGVHSGGGGFDATWSDDSLLQNATPDKPSKPAKSDKSNPEQMGFWE